MLLDESLALHEHAAGAAAGVVHATSVRRQHLHQHTDDAARRIELAALPPLGARELREEVLVDPTQHVLRPRLAAAHLDVADHLDQLPERLLVEPRPRVLLRQHALERRVVALDGHHRGIHRLADGWLRRLALDLCPARLGRHPEDADGAVLIRVLGVSALASLRLELRVLFLEGVGDVLQEDEPEHDVLVLARVHVVAERIRHLPQPGLEPERRAVRLLLPTVAGCHRAAPRYGGILHRCRGCQLDQRIGKPLISLLRAAPRV